MNNITFEFIFHVVLPCRHFSFAAHHQQNFKATYRINNNITGQNRIKHSLHNNGNNNNNNNNNTSHSPSSRPNTMKRKKHCAAWDR